MSIIPIVSPIRLWKRVYIPIYTRIRAVITRMARCIRTGRALVLDLNPGEILLKINSKRGFYSLCLHRCICVCFFGENLYQLCGWFFSARLCSSAQSDPFEAYTCWAEPVVKAKGGRRFCYCEGVVSTRFVFCLCVRTR